MTTPLTAPPAFHVLAKPSGPICNLDCTYCFFLSKEALYPGDRFRMTDEVLEAYIRQLLEALIGQLYLVTVVAVLVSRMASQSPRIDVKDDAADDEGAS